MCVDQHHNKYAYIVQIRQFIFHYNIIAPHKDFDKSQITFQALHGKAGSTIPEE